MYNLGLGILLHTHLWIILCFVTSIPEQNIHGMSMGYDHLVDNLTFIWTSLEILTYTRDM